MAGLETRAVAGSTLVLTRPGMAAPSAIDATAQLDGIGLTVSLRVRVDPGGTARVVVLSVSPLAAIVGHIDRADDDGTVPPGAVTSRALRGIRLDELAREAVRQQERPAAERDDVRAGAFQLQTGGPVWYADPPIRRPRAEQVAAAARIYLAAAEKGSRAPTVAVVNELGYSRSHASRLIRQARDEGSIPGNGSTR